MSLTSNNSPGGSLIPVGPDRDVPVIVLANDVVPGMGMAVAAPGLRAHGLAAGLSAAGFQVTQLVANGPAQTKWHRRTPPPVGPGIELVRDSEIADYLRSRTPAVVVAINSNLIDCIPEDPDLRLVLDLFAPRVLEIACRAEEYPVEEIRNLRARNLRAMTRADAFIINGQKKIPFYLGWLMQVDRDPRPVEFDVVPMPMPKGFDDTVAPEPNDRPIQVVTAGYLQGWSRPGRWFQTVADSVAGIGGTFHALLAVRHGIEDGLGGYDMEYQHEAVRRHSEMLFSDFQRFIAGKDMAIDLFERTVERDYAMVTRTVAAIASGLPVIHSPWGEVAPYIEDYDAGWLVDPRDESSLVSALKQAFHDRDALAAKAANSRRLWADVFRPEVATAPLTARVETLSAELGSRR